LKKGRMEVGKRGVEFEEALLTRVESTVGNDGPKLKNNRLKVGRTVKRDHKPTSTAATRKETFRAWGE